VKYDDLEDVNREFNAYEYETEVGDDWTPIDLTLDKADDCDSYATAKAERLLKMGWPRSALRIGHCDRHLVLLADLDGQTWLLDNRYPHPMRYQDVGYKWLEFGHLDTGKWELA
jgi:predicted transglutaminase-like cysteine proteinase